MIFSRPRRNLWCGVLGCVLGGTLALWLWTANRGASQTLQRPAAADPGLLARVQTLEQEVIRLARTSPPIGAIIPFVGDVAAIPPDWQLCNGDPLKDAQSPLRAVLKDGKVPDLKNRFLRGTSSAPQLLVTGGKESQDLSHSHDVDLDTKYGWKRDDFYARRPENDPREKQAYITNSGALGGHGSDAARPKVKGKTESASLTVNTLPPYCHTYYLIRIK